MKEKKIITVEEALNKLAEGNRSYIDGKSDVIPENERYGSRLQKGQSPYAVILSCSDSRVVPELIFHSRPGELFVIRVAGNIASKSSIASIEFAVSQLGSKLIVVMGHENCGAVNSAIVDEDYGHNLNHLINQIKPALDLSDDPEIDELIVKNAINNAEKIMANSEIISAEVESGEVLIVPAFYHIGCGKVDFLI